MELVFHEGKHAFQRYAVLNVDKFPQDEKDKINKWKENEYSYFKTDPLYERQTIERDAYAYGETKTNDFFNCEKLKDEALTSYKTYRDERNDHNLKYERDIKDSLGENYKEILEVMIKAKYLGQEYNKLLDQIGNKVLPDKQEQQLQQIVGELQSWDNLTKNTKNQLKGNAVQGQTLVQMSREELQQIERSLKQTEQQINTLAGDLHINNITPDVPRIIYGRAITDTSLTPSSEKQQDIDTMVQPVTINDLRSTLNSRMDETNKQLTELNQERDQVKGAPLTKEQAEKLAGSNHLNGADKQLDKQAQELQSKQDKLSQYEKDNIAFGKEHGLDKTLWRHAPEIFKGEGLKYYESSMATVENNKQVFDRQAAEIQTKREQLEVRLQTPDARSEIAKKSEEYLAQDKERLAKLELLDRKLNELHNEKSDIIKLKDVIPSRNREKELNVQGDVQNVQNLLRQTDQIKQQVVDMQQTLGQSRGRGCSL